MATGTRSGYWVEILHLPQTSQVCYAIHRPIKDKRPEVLEKWADLCRAFPYTWDGLQVMAATYLGREDAAETLEQYDDGRTATRQPIDAHHAQAYAKWIR